VHSSSTAAPEPPGAAVLFGPRIGLARRFADQLATAGVARGLLGPREVPRLWERHLINCALVTDLLPEATRIVDVGSGAGLPGIAMAIRRPDLRIDLVESLQRRVDFLTETVTLLGVSENVRVVRGRAEDRAVIDAVGSAQWVTARAVAPLDRLAKWCLPLLAPGGTLLAIKGATAADEARQHAAAIGRLGGSAPETVLVGTESTGEMVAVVVVRQTGRTGGSGRRRGSGGRK
jgi:16S rRNA (guanine527-N7)-methyltransferase